MIISKKELSKYIKCLTLFYLDVKTAEKDRLTLSIKPAGTILSKALNCVISLLQTAEEQCSFDYTDTDNVRFYPYMDIASFYPKFKVDIKTLNSVYGMTPNRKKGKWKPNHIYMYGTIFNCDKCGFEAEDTFHYCPNCGAQMEVDGDNE